jgi:hypothetical protein
MKEQSRESRGPGAFEVNTPRHVIIAEPTTQGKNQ